MSAARLLFVVTEDWYFCSHRLGLALEAGRRGFEVAVATRVGEHAERIRELGVQVIPIRLRRSSRDPFRELGCVREFVRIYRAFRPSIVHHVAMKPVLYGSLAARLVGGIRVVNALAGLGHVFVADDWRARAYRGVVSRWIRWTSRDRSSVMILQNPEDRAALVARGIVAEEQTRLIRGMGVDTGVFRPAAPADGSPVIMLAARLLWTKGVGEFVAAARDLRASGVDLRAVIVGAPDGDNPRAIPASVLEGWRDEGAVEWWGRRQDMPSVLAQAALFVLPTTYGEGVPKVLIEAASCEVPIVATDVPGCREIVRDGRNGLLVPPGDARGLASAIATLLADAERRRAMGREGRRLVIDEFSERRVHDETLRLYAELMDAPRAEPIAGPQRN